MMAIIFALLIAVLFDGCSLSHSKEDIEVDEEVTNVFEYQDTDSMKEAFYQGELSATQMQNEANKVLGNEPDFSETVDNKEEQGAINRTLEMQGVLTAYLDGLFIQQDKLNRVAKELTNELNVIEKNNKSPIRDKVIEVKGLSTPLSKGLLSEMRNTPLYLVKVDDIYNVTIDYDVIEREYKDYLTNFHRNLISLHRDIMENGYLNENKVVDSKVIFDRLVLLDDIQEKQRDKDEFYWEKERYQLAVLFTGYGKDQLSEWDDERIELMEELLEEHDMLDVDTNADKWASTTSYLNIAKLLVDSMEEEGKYGENTMRIANNWLHSEFHDYRLYLEEQESQKEETANKNNK